MSAVIEPVLEFLHAPTPAGWQQAALEHLPELLIDHANCEKKAASNAISHLPVCRTSALIAKDV